MKARILSLTAAVLMMTAQMQTAFGWIIIIERNPQPPSVYFMTLPLMPLMSVPVPVPLG